MNPGEAGEARTWFDIAARDAGTHLTWGFEHDHGMNLVGRYIAPLLAGVLKREHEQGLAALRELAETLPRSDFSDLEIEHLVANEQQIAYRTTSSTSDPGAISEAMGKAYFEILSFNDQHGLAEAGAPLSISRGFSGADLRFDAAIPVRGVDEHTPQKDGNVRLGSTQSGPVIRVKHIGPYGRLGLTHRKIVAYLSALGIARNGDPWETYVSDPTKVEESELLTFVYYPVRGH
jgi:effector-binding domain-containing protein